MVEVVCLVFVGRCCVMFTVECLSQTLSKDIARESRRKRGWSKNAMETMPRILEGCQ